MLRLLLPFCTGIAAGHYTRISSWACFILFILTLLLAVMPVPEKWRYRYRWRSGACIHLMFLSCGALLLLAQDARQWPDWFGSAYKEGDELTIALTETPVEKRSSWKATANVLQHHGPQYTLNIRGKLLVYLKKDSAAGSLRNGSRLLIKAAIKEIAGPANPGAFDYKRYCRFQGITHQVWLSAGNYLVLPGNNASLMERAMAASRSYIVQVFQKYIPGKQHAGLAEALVIGYKGDLDKTLLQSYANTGVVHIIAISGMHLALIYGLLLFITKPLKKRSFQWFRLILVLAGLWGFSLLAGGGPSILRAALMFTAIAASVVLQRRSVIFNTIALSAFALLCYQPYWLWDAGFQLSYLALLGLLLFYQPLYQRLQFTNKGVDYCWQLIAGSLAAQVFTLPVCLYYFHQFPLLFLPANLVAVPLSILAVYGGLLLCLVSIITPLALAIGTAIGGIISCMNMAVARLDALPFAVWDGIHITAVQSWLLYGAILPATIALFYRHRPAMYLSITSLICFVLLRTKSFVQASGQRQLLVYAIPRASAVDIYDGRNCLFMGDASLQEGASYQFHIKPARLQFRAKPAGRSTEKCFIWNEKRIFLLDTSYRLAGPVAERMPVIDLLVLSHRPKNRLAEWKKRFFIRQVVVDGSVPRWLAAQWEADCRQFHIPYHHVVDKGAFLMQP